MTMTNQVAQAITNMAPGPRLLNVFLDGKIAQIALQPDETRDLILADPDHAVVRGMLDNGDLLSGPAGTLPRTDTERFVVEADAWEAKVAAAYDRGFADAMKTKDA